MPLSPKVEAYLKNDFSANYANPSSMHLLGQRLNDEIEDDRRYVADFVGAMPSNIFFTSGATESINSILHPMFLQENGIDTVISSQLEHSAVDGCLARLKQQNIKVLYSKNSSDGLLCSEHLIALTKTHSRALVTLLGANNETGVMQDIAALTTICREHGCKTHLDGVQMLGKIPIDLNELGVDWASFSAHKVGGLKGVGFTYARNPAQFTPLIVGGGQENGLRGGTYNAGGIKSLRLALEDTMNWDLPKIQNIRDSFEGKAKNLNTETELNCANVPRICNTSNIHFSNFPAQAMVMELALRGIYVSSGSACNGAEPSRVLQGLGFDRDYAASCLRFSFADFNRSAEVEYAFEVLREVIDT